MRVVDLFALSQMKHLISVSTARRENIICSSPAPVPCMCPHARNGIMREPRFASKLVAHENLLCIHAVDAGICFYSTCSLLK